MTITDALLACILSSITIIGFGILAEDFRDNILLIIGLLSIQILVMVMCVLS